MIDFDNPENLKPQTKEFVVDNKRISRTVALTGLIAYNRSGKATVEKVNSFPQSCTSMFDYDENGNMIHQQVSTGLEYWIKYDDFGNKTYMRTSNGDEVLYEYDEAGNCIYSRSSRGFEMQYRYNNKNQKIFEFNSRFSEITLYQYDRNNNFIRSITSDGVVTKNTYDSNNNLVLTVTSGGTVEYYEYDDKGNMTYSVMGELFHEEIDVEDFQLDLSKLKQMETFFEYDFYPDGSIQRQYVYETQ